MADHMIFDENSLQNAQQAGMMAARYCQPDPAFWLDRAGLAGVELGLCSATGLLVSYLDADIEEATFLDTWLDASPEAKNGVIHLLRLRGCPSL